MDKNKVINLINTTLLNNSQQKDLKVLAEEIYNQLDNEKMIKDNVLALVPPGPVRRYFYLVYQAQVSAGMLTSAMYIQAESKNPEQLKVAIVEFMGKKGTRLNLTSLIILNIIELTASEYQAALS